MPVNGNYGVVLPRMQCNHSLRNSRYYYFIDLRMKLVFSFCHDCNRFASQLTFSLIYYVLNWYIACVNIWHSNTFLPLCNVDHSLKRNLIRVQGWNSIQACAHYRIESLCQFVVFFLPQNSRCQGNVKKYTFVFRNVVTVLMTLPLLLLLPVHFYCKHIFLKNIMIELCRLLTTIVYCHHSYS